MQQIQQRTSTSLSKEQNHEQGHKDDPLKESPKLPELAYCSHQLGILSCLQPDNQKASRISHMENLQN